MTEHRGKHACGGALVFIRQSNGHSVERCEGCGWFYIFKAQDVNQFSGTRTT